MDLVGQVLEEEALKPPPLDEVAVDVSFHGHSSWFQLHFVTVIKHPEQKSFRDKEPIFAHNSRLYTVTRRKARR